MKPLGRPRSPRLLEALRRVAAGETGYAVAKSMGMFPEQIYKALRKDKALVSPAPPSALP